MKHLLQLFTLLISITLFSFSTLNAQDWQLVWSDEFEGDSLDQSKWSFQFGTGASEGLVGWGNNELQYYTDRQENIFVEDGNLHIVARAESFNNRNYTSARIRSINKGDWKYGRFEFRAKLPEGQGLWPAIWMMPTDDAYGGWAGSGEIDIMELVGHEPDVVHGTLHYGGGWPDNVYSGDSYQLDTGKFSDDFHTFALEWEEGEMRWYVDGEHYQTQNNWFTQGHEFPAPFDKRFHLILNVAVGGNWPGSPDGSTIFPQEMVIDYIRVYQDAEQGIGVPLPVDFENSDFPWEHTFTNFDGGSVQIVDNPDKSGINQSDRVARMIKDGGAFWGGSWFPVATPFIFDENNHSISMKVWSPRENVPIALKVEQQNGDEEFESIVETTTSGEWEELTWDMTGAGFEDIWDVITVIFDLEDGQVGDGSENFTWFFDDVNAQASIPGPDDNGDDGNGDEGPDSPDELVSVSLPVDFEDRDFNWNYAFFGFDGGNASVVENPDPSGLNDSNWVGRMVKDGGAIWGGAFMHIDEEFRFDEENHTITMKVWSPRVGVPVLMKVEQQSGSEEYEISTPTETSGEWEELSWDMSGAGYTTDWDLITLIFDLSEGQSGDGSSDFTWFFDDLEVFAEGMSVSADFDDNQQPQVFKLEQNYPNPFNPVTQIEFTLPEQSELTLTVYDLMGRRVAILAEGQYQTGRHSVAFDASGLSSGMYIYRLQTSEFSKTRRMVLLK